MVGLDWLDRILVKYTPNRILHVIDEVQLITAQVALPKVAYGQLLILVDLLRLL